MSVHPTAAIHLHVLRQLQLSLHQSLCACAVKGERCLHFVLCIVLLCLSMFNILVLLRAHLGFVDETVNIQSLLNRGNIHVMKGLNETNGCGKTRIQYKRQLDSCFPEHTTSENKLAEAAKDRIELAD